MCPDFTRRDLSMFKFHITHKPHRFEPGGGCDSGLLPLSLFRLSHSTAISFAMCRVPHHGQYIATRASFRRSGNSFHVPFKAMFRYCKAGSIRLKSVAQATGSIW